MNDVDEGDPIDADWLNRNIMGAENIADMIGRGMLGPLPEDLSPFEEDTSSHPMTPLGRIALRDHKTVVALSLLHDLAVGLDGTKDYSPSRKEYEQLTDIARWMLIEIVALRGEVARLKGEHP